MLANDEWPRDRVSIEGLEVDAVVGAHASERESARALRFDLALGVDCRAAGRSDDLADAVDYAAVAERVRVVAAASAFHLLEALAAATATAILAAFPAVRVVRVKITKRGTVPRTEGVAVEIVRTRELESL